MNKEHKQLAGYNVIIGVILGMLLGFVPYLYLKEVSPYEDVKIVSVTTNRNTARITATFTKNSCEFQKLGVFGVNLRGDGMAVSWTPLDRLTKTENRLSGSQTLIIEIDTSPIYEKYEIRTRHNCDGAIVEKTFATVSIL